MEACAAYWAQNGILRAWGKSRPFIFIPGGLLIFFLFGTPFVVRITIKTPHVRVWL